MKKTMKAYMLVYGSRMLSNYSAVACPEENITTNFDEILDRLIDLNTDILKSDGFKDLRDKLTFDIAETFYGEEEAEIFDSLDDRHLWEYLYLDNEWMEGGYYYIVSTTISFEIQPSLGLREPIPAGFIFFSKNT